MVSFYEVKLISAEKHSLIRLYFAVKFFICSSNILFCYLVSDPGSSSRLCFVAGEAGRGDGMSKPGRSEAPSTCSVTQSQRYRDGDAPSLGQAKQSVSGSRLSPTCAPARQPTSGPTRTATPGSASPLRPSPSGRATRSWPSSTTPRSQARTRSRRAPGSPLCWTGSRATACASSWSRMPPASRTSW